MSKFQSVLSLQKEKYLEKIERKAYAQEVKRQFERESKVHEDKIIEMKTQERENDRKLESLSINSRPKMSKKRRMKIEKIR